jgi:hypothetical protein
MKFSKASGQSAPQKLWFEDDPTLNRAILLLEKVPKEQVDVIGQQAYEMANSLKVTNDESFEDVKTMGIARVTDLMHMKTSGRWFVSCPNMLRALTEIYFLNATDRQEIVTKLMLCLQALDSFNKQDLNNQDSWNARVAFHQVISKVFNQELEVFTEQSEKRLQEKKERLALQQSEEDDMLKTIEEEWLRIQSALEQDPTWGGELDHPELQLPPASSPKAPSLPVPKATVFSVGEFQFKRRERGDLLLYTVLSETQTLF